MTKMVSMRDDVYAKLVAVKKPEESFSNLFLRLLDAPKKSQAERLLEVAGIAKDWDDAEDVFREMKKRRSRHKTVTF
ncbi:antitoxin VapB family protein [archaeon]|nr:antitoxin VapB family protein [archaeon]